MNKIRRAMYIGKLMGWADIQWECGDFGLSSPCIHAEFPDTDKGNELRHEYRNWQKSDCSPAVEVLNDLNFWQFAEHRMGTFDWQAYLMNLEIVADINRCHGSLVHASAEERAEAFVLTMEPE